MEEKKYQFLNPRDMKIPGVKRLFERSRGKWDAKKNQLCVFQDGHITPMIDAKVSCYDSHINRIFLMAARELEPMIVQANALVVELNLLIDKEGKEHVIADNPEEERRQAAAAASGRTGHERRKTEILTGLAAVKSESDMVDEMLHHYEERAEGFLRSRISMYWRGVLMGSDESLAYFPSIKHRESEGRALYAENRHKLMDMIEEAIKNGGGSHEEECDEE